MCDIDLSHLTGAQQIEVMKSLSQQAAAWLVGATARTVRDHVEIPRDAAGRYNAQLLLTWAASRVPPAELTTEELDRALNATDLFFDTLSSRNEGAAVAIYDLLQGFQSRYGEGGLMAFAKEMLRQLRQRSALAREGWEMREQVTPEERRREIERQVEAALEAEAEHVAEADLDFAVVCDSCGRLRQGWQWVKSTPSPGRHVVPGCCPDFPDCNPHGPSKFRFWK